MSLDLTPHGQQIIQSIVIALFCLERVERLPHHLLHAWIPSVLDQIFYSRDKFGIEVASEGLAWIVGQDADQHDGIVLNSRFVVLGEAFSDLVGCGGCCLR